MLLVKSFAGSHPILITDGYIHGDSSWGSTALFLSNASTATTSKRREITKSIAGGHKKTPILFAIGHYAVK